MLKKKDVAAKDTVPTVVVVLSDTATELTLVLK